MYRLIKFLKRYYPALLFIALEILAVDYYARSSNYSRAKILTASNAVAGKVHEGLAWAGEWFTLRRDNRRLLESLAIAENELSSYREAAALYDPMTAGARDPLYGAGNDSFPEADRDSLQSLGHGMLPAAESRYFFSTAKVINSTITRKNNYFLLDKGMKDGVERNMSVVSPDGAVVGYVEDVSSSFAVCMSVLNRDFRIGGRVKDKDYVGSVYWDGRDTRSVTLSDIPKYAGLAVGDTIVSAYSSRFPPDLLIGTISELGDSPDGTYYQVKVSLGAKFARLSDVLLIKYAESEELRELEQQYFNQQQQ